MVSVRSVRPWLLALAAITLVASGVQAVRVLDSPDRLAESVHAYGAAQIDGEGYLVGGGHGQAFADEITRVEPDRDGTTVAELPEGLKSPAAAAHGGDVYIFGGAKATAQYDLPETTDAILRFDPATGEVEEEIDARLPDPVAGASAVTVGDRIYVLGGLAIQPAQDDSIDFVRTIAVFDPTEDTVSEMDAKLPTGRAQASAVAVDGEVVYLGGRAEAGDGTCEGSPTCFVGDVLVFSPEADSVTQLSELPVPVRWSAAAVHDDTVFVLGGCQDNCGAYEGTSAIQTVDPNTGETRQLPVSMPVTGGRNAALLFDGVAHIPGGVRANDEGSQDHFRILRVDLGATRPWAPVNVTGTSEHGAVKISWEPPDYDGGESVEGYVVERARGAREPTRLDRVSESPYRDHNASQGVTYTYRVRAANTQGVSPPSGEVRVHPTETPEAPTVTARGGDGKLVVQWSPPEDTGGLPISSYRVFAYEPDSDPDLERCATACWGKVANTTRRATIETVEEAPVENGNSYEVRVQARNDHGWGRLSEPSTAEAKPVPDAPDGLTAEPADGETRAVELAWQAPDKPVSAYVVYRGLALDELGEVATTDETSYRDEDELPEGEQILYAVSARNGGAEGPLSQPRTVVFAVPPGPVGDLSARWTGSHVQVAWESPNETGGQPVQTYEVARTNGATNEPESEADTIHRTAVERFQDGSPPRGEPLVYHVRAVTDAGEGPWEFRQVRVPLEQNSRPPVPALAAHPTKVEEGGRVVFDASGSEDEVDIVAYNFSFGDGEGTGWRSSPRVTHTYETAGAFNATVTVRDTDGLEATARAAIAVGPSPAGEGPEGPIVDGTGEEPDESEDASLGMAAVLAGLLGAALARARLG